MNELVTKILQNVWAVHPQHAYAYAMKAKSIIANNEMNTEDIKAIMEERQRNTKTYFALKAQGGKFAVTEIEGGPVPKGAIAVMRIKGIIMQEDGLCSRGIESYMTELEELGCNENVSGVLVEVNSPGGTAIGGDALARAIGKFEKDYNKPIASVIKPLAASAGYEIISHSPMIFVGAETAQAGSIGTMASFLNDQGMMEDLGLKEIIVRASASWNKNEPYYQAVAGNPEPLQREVLDPLNEVFMNLVKKGRRGKIDLTKSTKDGVTVPDTLTGKTYIGKDIVKVGLADAMGGRAEALKYIEKRAMELKRKSKKSKSITQMVEFKKMDIEQLQAKHVELSASLQKNENEEVKVELDLLEKEIGRRKEVEELKAELKATQEDLAKIVAKNKLEKEKESQDSEKITELEASLKGANENLKALQAKVGELESLATKLKEDLEATQKELTQNQEENEAYQSFLEQSRSKEKFEGFLQKRKSSHSQPEQTKKPIFMGKAEKREYNSQQIKGWTRSAK